MSDGSHIPDLVTPEILERAYIFSDVAAEQLEEISRIAEMLGFKSGAHILHKDKPNDAIWVLVEGKCVIRDSVQGGLEVDLFVLQPGDVFGEMSYTDRQPASATVVTVGDVKALRISFDDLDTWFIGNMETQCNFLRRMNATFSHRLRRANVELRKTFEASMKLRAE